MWNKDALRKSPKAQAIHTAQLEACRANRHAGKLGMKIGRQRFIIKKLQARVRELEEVVRHVGASA